MNNEAPVVVLDACVLYPAGLRNIFMWLAVHELIRPKWSEQIHEEWIRNVLEDRSDITRADLERTRKLMNAHAGDCLVSDYERHIDSLTLPDPDDCHVLAAAIESQSDAIVTWNTSDFPTELLEPFGIQLITPDSLTVTLIESYPEAVRTAMEEHRTSLRNPPKSRFEYLEMLQKQGLKESVALLNG